MAQTRKQNIAHDMRSDCDELKKASVAVKNWIAQQPAVKEESITDWLLYDISRNIPRIIYHAFSRHEEARRTGADWEWWFLFPALCAKMRVQAKKLEPGKNSYPSIAQTNQYGLQIEKLISDSKEKNFMPFYAFYSSMQERVMCMREINDEGVFLAGGNRLYNDFIQNGKTRLQPADVLSQCTSLSCFLCCPLCLRDGHGFTNFLRDYFPLETSLQGGQQANRASPQGIYAEVPSYVSSFIEYGRERLPDWWEEEFSSSIQGTNALVVYDAR